MEPQPWGKANSKLCQGLHFLSAANSEKNAPLYNSLQGSAWPKTGGKALGIQMFCLSTAAQTHMAINASTSINSSVKAAAGSFWSLRDPATAPSELQWAGRSCWALSWGNQVFHRETRHSTGNSLPSLAMGSANPKQKLQEGNWPVEWQWIHWEPISQQETVKVFKSPLVFNNYWSRYCMLIQSCCHCSLSVTTVTPRYKPRETENIFQSGKWTVSDPSSFILSLLPSNFLLLKQNLTIVKL